MKKFEAGQNVYSTHYGWGVVECINKDFRGLENVQVEFEGVDHKFSDTFTLDGRHDAQYPISLFHYEPEIIEPKWQPKEGEWCLFWEDNTTTALLAKLLHMEQGYFITKHPTDEKQRFGWHNCAPFPIEHLPEHLK